MNNPETMTKAEYLDTCGDFCPFCRAYGGHAVEPVQTYGEKVQQKMECGTCGKTWNDQYKLTGYEARS